MINSQVFYIENFINIKNLTIINNWTKNNTPEKDPSGNTPFEHFSPFKSDDVEIRKIFDKLQIKLYKTIKTKFLISVYQENIANIMIYKTGDFLPEHIDNMNEQKILTPTGYASRDISSTIYFNDNYLGGEIFFPKQDLKIKPSAGSVVMFPSHDSYPHLVFPVLSGVRYSATNFWCIN